MTVYQKTQEFFAAHFNETAYPKFAEATKWPGDFDTDSLVSLLLDIHGHNFRATVRVDGEITKDSYSSYLISDEAITQTVNEWQGINLSVHPDFMGSDKRATTENMAEVLARKIGRQLLVSAKVTVTIHESQDILAEYSANFTVA